MTSRSEDTVLTALREVVGEAHVLTQPDMVAGYVRDWTGRWIGPYRRGDQARFR